MVQLYVKVIQGHCKWQHSIPCTRVRIHLTLQWWPYPLGDNARYKLWNITSFHVPFWVNNFIKTVTNTCTSLFSQLSLTCMSSACEVTGQKSVYYYRHLHPSLKIFRSGKTILGWPEASHLLNPALIHTYTDTDETEKHTDLYRHYMSLKPRREAHLLKCLTTFCLYLKLLAHKPQPKPLTSECTSWWCFKLDDV